jgi:glutamate-5-semialdehyde dehydrogenase
MSAVDPALEGMVKQLAQQALRASRELGVTPTATKNAVLQTLASLIEERAETLKSENAKDLEAGRASGLRASLLDRLELTPARLAAMAEGVRQVATLNDPVGAFLETYDHPKGFVIRKKRVPIGVIGIIYESRPNVTIDCAALCLKSGNAAVLRGGKEAIHSNRALAALIAEALSTHGVSPHAVQLIPTTDRAALNVLLKLDAYVHCLIPRGGEGLIRFVAEHARMPVIKHYDGICSIYVDPSADVEMATKVVVNAKAQRPSVCNAAENLVVHTDALESHLLPIARGLREAKVELRADAAAYAALTQAGIPVNHATEDDFRTEYLDYIIAIKTVASPAEAIEFINTHGSGHSDAVLAEDPQVAEQFLNAVDSATVYWNVSTRFTDGFEFGKGAEIGISTDRLHARGPVGLEELTSYKYVITGHGEIK